MPEFKNRLHERIYAVNAISIVANSMGDLPEGMHWRDAEAKFGFLEDLLPQDEEGRIRRFDWGPEWHYHPHHRPAGMGEDGQERHRLMVEAIAKRGGRITCMDLGRSWVELIRPENFGYLLGPQDQVIYYAMRGGIVPHEAGRYATYPGFHGTSKMIQPVGLVNACDPDQAARDAHDVGRIKDVHGRPANHGLEVAAGMAAGIAEAMKPGATVGKVIDRILRELGTPAREECERALEWARLMGWQDLRERFAVTYEGRIPWNATEVLSSALALFWQCDGDLETGMLRAVNFGRDTDDRAYDVAGLCAAMHGMRGIRPHWLETCAKALEDDAWTVSRRSFESGADALYAATVATAEASRARAEAVAALM